VEKTIKCCDLCGRSVGLTIPSVGIAFGMGGDDYAFCEKCLDSLTAMEFWKAMAKLNNLRWPLNLTIKD
jgi:hypothetical protein